MELWFMAAVGGAIFAGLSNFCFKIAAKRHYNSELFVLYGGVVSLVFVVGLLLCNEETLSGYGIIPWVVILGGAIASGGGIMKTYGLRHIDATIFFPLFKLLSPALAVIAGIVLFAESFTYSEWLGITLGLLVPILLINKVEQVRQSNLVTGLVLVFFTAVSSATAAILNKYAIDVAMPVSVVLFYATIGIFAGSLMLIIKKQGYRGVYRHIREDSDKGLVLFASLRAVLICTSFMFVLFAYQKNGLGIVQTIQSMYILIPIVLAIVFYKEHWNLQKVVAIILSVAALAMFQ